jgi:hypothetical protein
VGTGLACDLETEPPQGSDNLLSRQITGQLHARTRIGSLTK